MIHSEYFKKYFVNTSWLFFEHIVRLSVALFVSVYVARYLGPDNYGLLNYSISFVGLFSVIATLGLDQIVIRELVKDRSKRDFILGTTFLLKILGAFLVLILLAIGIQFTSNDSFTNLLIFIIAAGTLFQSINVIDFYFQSRVQSRFIVQVKFWSIMGISLLKIYSIHIEAPLLWFAFLVLVENIILALGFFMIYKSNGLSVLSWKFDMNLAKLFLKNSWPLIFSSIFVTFYIRIDQVMINEILDSKAVGIYASAVKLSEAWYFVPMIISSSLYPAIIEAKKISEDLYYTRLQQLYDLLAIIAIVIILPVTILSDWIIIVLYGQEYIGAGTVLSIHIWAGLFVFLGVARGKWILAENLQTYTFLYTFLGALSNVILNLYMIPLYGINGAAFATLISQFVSVIVVPFIIKETRTSVFMLIKSILLISQIQRLRKIIYLRKN
ncbi:flippase [Methanolobus vulcani]|uniref:Flippase n=2 Tax=Methanolobus vulcani TaxID=38026 RepID=A0A7Z8KM74_9EURY|nr:flippase [Methanolobus vulcani]